MAEVAGLVIGAVALLSTFKDCIDLVSCISAAKSFSSDFEILNTQLDIEKTLLLQWADRVQLLKPNGYDKRLDEPVINNVVSRILSAIRLLLSQSTDLQQRYGMERTEASTTVVSAMSGPRLRQFLSDFEKLSLRIDTRQQEASIKQRLCWVVRDKEKFRDLIQQLSTLVAKLDAVVPAGAGHVEVMTRRDIQMVDTLHEVQLVLEAAKGYQTSMALLAKDNINERCRRRILDCLWFRMIGDRRNGISNAHHQTFKWALHPPMPDVKWSDLSEWLRTGSGIYWVSGKAGSGKSTLMKNLYEDRDTKALLKEWAGDKPLLIPNFFFWYLGGPEQKTLEGLCRALLYYILDSDPSLIPKLLPAMWRDAHKDNISLPSTSEMIQAFSTLGHQCRTEKFCFFIDGLDEYDGNISEGIQFINNLASNSNIKVLVSSRPISACYQAYSSKPKLKLQDLTRGDIETYVVETFSRHPRIHDYMLGMDANSVARIHRDIVDKASGVFLWVILACRSILQGLDAYDSLAELQRRVDELPPELESLFTQILNKIEPRYRRQAAKLLKICYQYRINMDAEPEARRHLKKGSDVHMQLSGDVYTLGLAFFDNFVFDTTQPPDLFRLSADRKRMQCKVLKERLRSRCYGLLEIHQTAAQCFCGQAWASIETTATSAPRNEVLSHDGLVDSVVGFMHRSVFEFLNSPQIWDLDCLQISDNNFDSNTALARMYIDLVYSLTDGNHMNSHSAGQIAELTIASLVCARNVDDYANNAAVPTLLYIAKTMLNMAAQIEGVPEVNRYFPLLTMFGRFFGTTNTAEPRLALALAVELGMINVTRQWKGLSTFQDPKLLHYALYKPITRNFGGCFRVSPQILGLLLSHGYSHVLTIEEDNAHFSGILWGSWIPSLPRPLDPASRITVANIIELLIEAGADLDHPYGSPELAIEQLIYDYVTNTFDNKSSIQLNEEYRLSIKRCSALLELIASKRAQKASQSEVNTIDVREDTQGDLRPRKRNTQKQGDVAAGSEEEGSDHLTKKRKV
ncbi:prion-inhibition and propagation-domain-containing protein [Nemania sp. FL0031]|nr:prion-inhibition and propagation-domain-containing protein [Nemania sp. FL0031]